MEMWNISRTGGRFSHAIVFGVMAALSACSSSSKHRTDAPNRNGNFPVSTGELERSNGGETYGPFPGTQGPVLSSPVAPSEMIENPDQIVLVLGHGLTHGYTHVGVLRALRELKIPVHSIYATEVGAMAAALYYTQPNPNRIDWALLHVTEKNLGASTGKFSFRLNSAESDLEGKLREIFGDRRVEAFGNRLHIHLEDAKTKESFEARSGDLWRVVRGALAGGNQFSPIDLEGRSVRSGGRKISESYRIARQTERYPIVVVSAGEPPSELFRKLIENERATLVYVPLPGIDDLDLKKRNQAVFAGKNAVHRAAKEILSLVGRKPE